MPFDPIDELLNRLESRGGQWPPRAFEPAWKQVREWRAFLETDRPALAAIAGWTDTDRPYKADPLPERIAEAWSDHLWGEDPDVTPANDTDTGLLQDLVDGNELPDELRAGERICAGEGEVWWRLGVDEDLADVPLIEWHPRTSVAPLFIGRRLAAAALVTVLDGPGAGDGRSRVIYRHFEVHGPGLARHVLYRGTKGRLGEEVDLDRHPETEGLDPEWRHGLDMLMGRIVNRRGRRFDLGRSEYHGIRDYLLELNEALTIGGENMRLTAKKRAVVDESVMAPDDQLPDSIERFQESPFGDGLRIPVARARFRAGDDVLVASNLDRELGRDSTGMFKILEYSYDAEALIAHKRDLVESALTRVGLTPQWVGVITGGADGYALTGTALRARLIPTDKAGRGKARPWDEALPKILSLAAQIDALPVEQGGFGRAWTAPADLPGVERANPLPTDEVEDAQVESTLLSAGGRSRETSVRRQHPEWSDDDVAAELERIAAEHPAGGAFGLGAGA